MQEDLLEQANAIGKNTLLENFEIFFIEVGKDYLIAQMPVTQKNCQINGILHGGASAALAETVGSMASVLLANPDKQLVLGTDITMNHIRPAALGKTGTGRIVQHQRFTADRKIGRAHV